MKNIWYRLEFTLKNKTIIELEKIIEKFFDDPRFCNDVMVFRPNKTDFRTIVWIFPPRTVNLMLEKALRSCGALECPQPKIEDVTVDKGNVLDIQSFFPDE